jgi:hypothetical protein
MKFEIDIKNKLITINDIKLKFDMLYEQTFITDEIPYPDDKVIKKIKENTRLHYDKNKELWLIISIKDFGFSTQYIAYNLNTKKRIDFNGYPTREMFKQIDLYKETEMQLEIDRLNGELNDKPFNELLKLVH